MLRLKVSRKEISVGGSACECGGEFAKARARMTHEAAHDEEVCLALLQKGLR